MHTAIKPSDKQVANIEERLNAVQSEKYREQFQEEAKTQAFLKNIMDSTLFWEALGPDGIQYPATVAYQGKHADKWKNQQDHQTLVEAQLRQCVLDHYHGDKEAASKLGEFLIKQCISYVEAYDE